MIRALALLVFAGAVAVLLFAPGIGPSRVAAMRAGDLMTADAVALGPGGEPMIGPEGEPVPQPMWRFLLESPAVVDGEDEDGRPTRTLLHGGGNFRATMESVDANSYIVAINSVVRELRSISSSEGLDIDVPTYKKQEDGGINLEFRIDEELSIVTANIEGTPLARAEMARPKVTQLSLLPPLVAIFLAILFRRPVIALFAGVLVGAFLVRRAADATFALTDNSLVDVFRVYLTNELRDNGRTEIILFVVFMLAMVGVITRAGGIRGIMNRIALLAKDARQTQVATWLMGLTIFFDDYANTILVGSTMRPLADRFKVAREKLAYIVDSTAAPVAGVSLLSTWIAFEVSTFSAQLPDAGLAPADGYAVFLQTLPFRFYCWFTLLFVGMNVLMGRDFGPMLTAERRARGGKLLRDGATPLVGKAATEIQARDDVEPRALTALVPLLVFVGTVLGKILFDGARGEGILVAKDGFPFVAYDGSAVRGFIETSTSILYAGSGNKPLMYGAIAGFAVAAAFALRRGLSPKEILVSAVNSIRAMFIAIVILYLAWMVGRTCGDLGTATYLSATLTDAVPYVVLPLALFLLSGVIAFSTGSSWSTMTILLPLVVGLSYDIGYAATPAGADAVAFGQALLVICIGAVLEGAIFGDHCSPISDTTVMSSIACASDHIDHVRTQAPYAILTMTVALLVGYLPVVMLDLSPWISLALGAATLYVFLLAKGKRVDEPTGAAASVAEAS